MEKHFGTRTSSNQDFVQVHFVAFLSFVAASWAQMLHLELHFGIFGMTANFHYNVIKSLPVSLVMPL